MGPYTSIDQIKAQHAAYTGHSPAGFFFSPGAMRGFHTRVFPEVYGGRWFITSNQCVHTNGHRDPRTYTVHRASDEGDIVNEPECQHLSSASLAKKKARELAEQAETEKSTKQGEEDAPSPN